MKLAALVSLASLPFLVSALPSAATKRDVNAITVNTTSGIVTGHSARNVSVSEFLGIRYAQPTNGTLRFQPPVAFRSSAEYAASDYSPSCPFTPSPPLPTFPNKYPNFDRIYSTFTGQGGKEMSEDCLALNVWVKNPDPTNLKPVIVFVHGGRFATGNSNITFYEGQYVADTGDAVMVTINYRLAAFGFSGAPGQTQNVGLLDQRMALEWVRDNIAAFGGDPTKIILNGQSVGGLSVDYHTYAWASDPIMAGAMSLSGTAASVLPNTANLSLSYWNQLATLVGCPTTSDGISCMQGIAWATILTATGKIPPAATIALNQPVFQETVDNITVFSDYAARGKAGKFAKVPYLVGNAHYEAGFYKLAAFASNKSLTDSQWDLFNAAGFTCASKIAAENRIANGVTSYRYRYFGDWANLRLYPDSGAYHGTDLNMWFGVGTDVSGQNNTHLENKTSKYMMKALIKFAKDPEHGLKKYGWPKYTDNSNQTLVLLGYNNQTTASFVAPAVYDTLCAGLNGDTSVAQGAM